MIQSTHSSRILLINNRQGGEEGGREIKQRTLGEGRME